MKHCLTAVLLVCLSLPGFAQAAKKLRVLAAPGVSSLNPKSWHNSLAVSRNDLVLTCPKCAPIQTISITKDQVSALRYGQNAYHHWVSGVVTGFFTVGIGAIVGFMPHHQHFFSVDLKTGQALGIQADKHDYRQIAGMLENFAGLPIQVSAKDAHFLAGYNTEVLDSTAGK